MSFKPGIDNDAEIFKSTSAQITNNVARGYAVLNQLIAVGEFSDNNLNHEKINYFVEQINNNGFMETLQQTIDTLKFKGRSLVELQKLTAQYKYGRNLIDILQHGQRALMKPNFKPNGYNNYRQSPSYEQYRAVCNYHMFELLYQGKAIIIPMANIPTSILKLSHGSKLELVQSSKKEGRCCLNAGSKCRNYMSLNDGTDRERCLKQYPKDKLPTIRDICELAEIKRSICEPLGELVVGATIDVSDAYRQYTLSAEASMHRSVLIYIGEQRIPHIVYPLVGWYGDAIAGDVYNIAGGYISWFHNCHCVANDCNDTTTLSSNNSTVTNDLHDPHLDIIENPQGFNIHPHPEQPHSSSNKLHGLNLGGSVEDYDDTSIRVDQDLNNAAEQPSQSHHSWRHNCYSVANDCNNTITLSPSNSTVTNDLYNSHLDIIGDSQGFKTHPHPEQPHLSPHILNGLNLGGSIGSFDDANKKVDQDLNNAAEQLSQCYHSNNDAFATSAESKYLRSVTYIDDGILIDSSSLMEQSRSQYREGVANVFGPDAVAAKKDIYWGQDLQAIGWHLNTRYEIWRVAPKQKGLDKIYASLFIRLPPNVCDEDAKVFVIRKVLHEIASLLSWYAVVLRLGNPFVRSIFKNCGYGPDHVGVEINLNCKRDLAWWKLISHASMSDPHLLSASISHLRINVVANEILFTDASTSIGGGGWIANSVDDVSSSRKEGFIRWSDEEILAFESGINGKKIDINVLEFFVVVYFVLLWGHELKGKVVKVKCDNTAAISWLLIMRASNKSPVAETLVKLFALYCAAMDITLLPSHIPGIFNVHADFLSRDISLQESQESLSSIKDSTWWRGLSRPAICRLLLMASIARPHTIPLQSTLELLKLLR